MLILDTRLCNLSRRSAWSHRASGQDGMLRPGRTTLWEGLFVVAGHGTGSSNMTITASTCGVETVRMASFVSSVVDHCRVDGDASASSGVEGVCASPTEGTRTALLTSVCCIVALVFSVSVAIISVLEVGA